MKINTYYYAEQNKLYQRRNTYYSAEQTNHTHSKRRKNMKVNTYYSAEQNKPYSLTITPREHEDEHLFFWRTNFEPYSHYYAVRTWRWTLILLQDKRTTTTTLQEREKLAQVPSTYRYG